MDRDYGMQAIVDEQGAGKARSSVAVANLTGGVGKTTASRVIHYMWLAEGVPLSLVSVDSVDEASTSKLAAHGDRVEQMTLGVDMGKVGRVKFGNAYIEHWTRIGDILAEGGHLIDFGANAIQHLLDWAAESEPRMLLEDAPPLIVVVPVTSVAQSAADALVVLKRFAAVEPVFMKSRAIVAFNDKYGPTVEAVGPAFTALRAYMRDHKIESFDLPEGTIQLGEDYAFMELKTVHPADFGRRLGISPMLANTRLKFFTKWLDKVVENATAVGLGPGGAANAKAA